MTATISLRLLALAALVWMAAPGARAQDLPNRYDVAAIKQLLATVGCYAGPIDAIDDAAYREAIGCFQVRAVLRKKGTEDGEIDRMLLSALAQTAANLRASEGVSDEVDAPFGPALVPDAATCGHAFLVDLGRSRDGVAHIYRTVETMDERCDETAGFFAGKSVPDLREIVVYHLSGTDGDLLADFDRGRLARVEWWRGLQQITDAHDIASYLQTRRPELGPERYLEGQRHAALTATGHEGGAPDAGAVSDLFRKEVAAWIGATGANRGPASDPNCATAVRSRLVLCTNVALWGDVYCGSLRWNRTNCGPSEGWCHETTGAMFSTADDAVASICN